MFKLCDYVTIKPDTNKNSGNMHSAILNGVYLRNMPKHTIFKVIRVNRDNDSVLLYSHTCGIDEFTALNASCSNVETKHLQKVLPFLKKETHGRR